MGRHSLKARLIAALLGLAAIPVLLLGMAQTWMAYSSLTDEAVQAETANATALGMEVAAYLGGFERELKVAARLQGHALSYPKANLPMLRRLVADRQTYREVAVLDAAGIETARVSTIRLVDAEARPDRSAEDLFREPARTGMPYFGRVHFAPDDGEPLIDLALPILDPANGRLQVVLHAELRVRALWDRVAGMHLEPGEEIYILDEDNRVIAHRNPSIVLAQTVVEPVREPSLRRTGLHGAPVLSAARTLTVGGRNLTVIAERTVSEALASARNALWLSVLVVVLAMAAAVILMAASVRTVLAPIRAVAQAARAVRDGDLSLIVPVRSNDEIGDLADTFNGMTAQLRTVLAELRHEVAERGENERRFRAIFEQAAVGMALAGLDGRFLAVNDRLCTILGYAPAVLTGLSFEDITVPEDLSADMAQIDRLMIGEAASYAMEKRYLRRDGAVVWVNVTMSLVRAASGAARMFVAVIEDISVRKEAEHQLRCSVDELSRSNLELERFAYVASHDLQEPLRNVIAFAQMLERKAGGDPALRDPLAYIIGGAYRMRDLVQGLLTYSRAGGRQEPFAPVPLAAVVAEAQTNLQAAITESGAVLTVGEMPAVLGDRLQLVQLLQNLIGNAIKFRQPDGPPEITVSAESGADQVTVSVADNGIGIEPEYRDQVFVIFKRLHGPDAYPGVGIGLAICHRIVERHGGRIWIEDRPGGGTVIRFTVPRAVVAKAVPAEAACGQ